MVKNDNASNIPDGILTESTGVRNTCVYVNVCTCFLLSTLLFASIPTDHPSRIQLLPPVFSSSPSLSQRSIKQKDQFVFVFVLFCSVFFLFLRLFLGVSSVEFCWFFRVPRRAKGHLWDRRLPEEVPQPELRQALDFALKGPDGKRSLEVDAWNWVNGSEEWEMFFLGQMFRVAGLGESKKNDLE